MPGKGLMFTQDNTTVVNPTEQLRVRESRSVDWPAGWFMLQPYSWSRELTYRISAAKEKSGLISSSLVLSTTHKLDGLPEHEVCCSTDAIV